MEQCWFFHELPWMAAGGYHCLHIKQIKKLQTALKRLGGVASQRGTREKTERCAV